MDTQLSCQYVNKLVILIKFAPNAFHIKGGTCTYSIGRFNPFIFHFAILLESTFIETIVTSSKGSKSMQ